MPAAPPGVTITVEDTGDVAGAVAVTGDTGAATGVTQGAGAAVVDVPIAAALGATTEADGGTTRETVDMEADVTGPAPGAAADPAKKTTSLLSASPSQPHRRKFLLLVSSTLDPTCFCEAS
jgi:hypothetical protein